MSRWDPEPWWVIGGYAQSVQQAATSALIPSALSVPTIAARSMIETFLNRLSRPAYSLRADVGFGGEAEILCSTRDL
jgi:hypothetical protein